MYHTSESYCYYLTITSTTYSLLLLQWLDFKMLLLSYVPALFLASSVIASSHKCDARPYNHVLRSGRAHSSPQIELSAI